MRATTGDPDPRSPVRRDREAGRRQGLRGRPLEGGSRCEGKPKGGKPEHQNGIVESYLPNQQALDPGVTTDGLLEWPESATLGPCQVLRRALERLFSFFAVYAFLYSIGYLAGWAVALFVIAEPVKHLGRFLVSHMRAACSWWAPS